MLVGAKPDSFSIAKECLGHQKGLERGLKMLHTVSLVFDVDMPMLYGEGERAFIRLQEEIMKHSNDHSLFAWSVEGEGYRGLLAKSPANFRRSHDIVPSINRLSHVP